MEVDIRIRRLEDELGEKPPVPKYATDGAAAFDLTAHICEPITLLPGERTAVPTGIQIEVPEGYAAFVYARSGLAIRSGITLSNCVRLIASDYRGEILVGLVNQSDEPYAIERGDRIAQVAIQPVVRARLEDSEELGGTQRGSGGFGSTGR